MKIVLKNLCGHAFAYMNMMLLSKRVMGNLVQTFRVWQVSAAIMSRHLITYDRRGLDSRLEHEIVNAFGFENKTGLFVHWGMYDSGQTWAAGNAAIRLQQNCGRFAIFLDGHDFLFKKTPREWLQANLGIPEDCRKDMIPMYLPLSHKPMLIIDHVDYVLNHYGGRSLVLSFQELGIPVLCLVRSWENALDLHNRGCQLLGTPGFSRWTESELLELYNTLPQEIQQKCKHNKEAMMEYAVLSGSPGIFWHNSVPNMQRAKLMDAEWKNGIRALNGEDMQGVTGRFPDKNGTFHWD